MKKIMYALLATTALVGGLWVWHAQQSPKMLWSDEDPNYGILRLDILFGLQIG